MGDVVQIRLEETVGLDREQLNTLNLRMGAAGADRMVGQAMEELAVELARVEKRFLAGQIKELRTGSKAVISISQRLGLTSLARVARDVIDLSNGYDSTAFCAVMARLIRIGESSLVAVWDLQDMSV